jgi:hypothetical protein
MLVTSVAQYLHIAFTMWAEHYAAQQDGVFVLARSDPTDSVLLTGLFLAVLSQSGNYCSRPTRTDVTLVVETQGKSEL